MKNRFWAGASITLAASALSSMLPGGCILSDDKCDAHQVHTEGDGTVNVCVCEPNAIPSASGYGCTPCGSDEVVVNEACVCKEGYQKPSDGGPCTKSDIGAACGADSPCAGDFPYCVMSGSAPGYCTSTSCTSNAMCPSAWTCETADDTRYCEKPRSGLGVHCESNEDCAKYDAKFCDTFRSGTCVLGFCADGSTVCTNESSCCDFSALFGSALSLCVSESSLENGMCPMGGKLVQQ